MKRLVTIVLTLAIMAIGTTAMAAVLTTPHDYSGETEPVLGITLGQCNVCHLPHAAAMQQRIWIESQSWVDGGTWLTSTVGRLCGRCHNGSVATISGANANTEATEPHDVETTAYSADAHGRSITELTTNIKDTPADATTRPYMTGNMQCTSCHDPHQLGETGNTLGVMPFLRATSDTTISDVCTGCHDRQNAGATPLLGQTNEMQRGANDGSSWSSMHPAGNVNYGDFDGNEGPVATLSTVLRSLALADNANGPLLQTAINDDAWVLGGKFERSAADTAGNTIGCETCHAVHGTTASNAAPDNIYLLAINNSGQLANAPLCETCHGGGIQGVAGYAVVADGAGGSDATVKSYYVAAEYLAANPPLDDHPIDRLCDGTPALVNWDKAANYRWERTTWGAKSAGDAAGDNWPFGDNTASTYSEANLTFGTIVCISCHSAHNGITQTSLRRKGGTEGMTIAPFYTTENPTQAEMNAETDAIRSAWCYNCHAQSDMVPSFHHSTNDTGGQPANYDAGEIFGAGSGVQCNSCHLMGTVMNAHNGFFNLQVFAQPNDSSQLCLPCHPAADVSAAGTRLGPNGHLVTQAAVNLPKGSHYIGTFADGSSSGDTWDIHVKRGTWRTVNGEGIYSKYGDSTPGNTADTHHTTAPRDWVNTQTVICESCHSVLYNAGWDGVGNATWENSAGGAAQWTSEGGWRTNLLLQLYEERAPGVGQLAPAPVGGTLNPNVPDVDGFDTGVGLCIQCHNQGDASGITTHPQAGTNNGLVLGTLSWGGAINQNHAPKNMHPMTGWTITRAVDSGRFANLGIQETLFTGAGSYADSPDAPDQAASIPAGSGNIYASYPADNAMDCDSCHRPHLALEAFVPGTPQTGTGSGDDVPAILEAVQGPGVVHADTVCTTCHNR